MSRVTAPIANSVRQGRRWSRRFATWAGPVLVLATGDEVAAALTAFASRERLSAARFTAIGALSDAVLGYFDWETREYARIPVQEQIEVLALLGDVAMERGQPKVHAHVVVGKRDGAAHGGHLLEAHVRPTLEVILTTEAPARLSRVFDPRSGLALIDVDASSAR